MSRLKKALTSFALKTGLIEQNFYPLNSYNFLGKNSSFGYSDVKDDLLINEGYASNTHLYAIINKLQNLSSNGIYRVMVTNRDGSVEEDTESDLYQLLQNPNEEQTFREFLDACMTMLPVTGDLFLLGTTPVGFRDKIMSLDVLPSNITDVLVSKSTYQPIGYEVTLNGKNIRYSTDEVYHGKLYNPTVCGLEGHRGMSPLQAAYSSLDTDNQIFNAKRNFYKNNGVNGIISSGSDVTTLGYEEAKQLDEALRKRMGGSHRANSLTVTGANVNYTAIGMSASSMDFINSGDISLRDLCMVYGMDSKLFGDPKASTYNNQAEAAKGVWTNSVIPYNKRLVDYLNRFVVPTHSAVDNKQYEIVYDVSHIEELQKDKKTEAEKNNLIIQGVSSIVSSSMSDEAKVLMLTKLYDIDENEATTIINQGEDSEAQGEDDEEETQSNNN